MKKPIADSVLVFSAAAAWALAVATAVAAVEPPASGAGSSNMPVPLVVPTTNTPATVIVSSNTSAMGKYSVITDKNVFTELTIPDPPSVQPPGPAAGAMGAFGKDYELKALIDTGVSIRAGFFDKKANNSFYISQGEAYDGLELISVNYDNEEAVLRRGGETCSFSLRPKPAGATTPALPSGAMPPPPVMAKPGDGKAPPNMPFKPEPGNTAYRGKTIEQFLRDHPEAAKQANSPIRVSAPNFKAFGKGMSIDQFLKENPDAMSQFPSPIQPTPTPTGNAGISKGEAIDRMMRQAQQGSGGVPAATPTPATPVPATPTPVPAPVPETITPLPPAPVPETTPTYPPDGTEVQY